MEEEKRKMDEIQRETREKHNGGDRTKGNGVGKNGKKGKKGRGRGGQGGAQARLVPTIIEYFLGGCFAVCIFVFIRRHGLIA